MNQLDVDNMRPIFLTRGASLVDPFDMVPIVTPSSTASGALQGLNPPRFVRWAIWYIRRFVKKAEGK